MPKRNTNKANNARNKLTGQEKPGVHRIRSKVKFFRPITKTSSRKPRVIQNMGSYLRSKLKMDGELQLGKVILQPVISDKNMTCMEKRNTVTFLVNPKANKNMIRAAFKMRFGQNVKKVNTLHTSTGDKKAYIRLGNEHKALELASKIGMI